MMGDRQNPIKFGPEWLRNLSRERNLTMNNSNDQTAAGSLSNNGHSSSGAAMTDKNRDSPLHGATRENGSNRDQYSMPSRYGRVLLAKLRYGREEMLALYDKNTDPPTELKIHDKLYQSRNKPPLALNTTFEERENARSGQLVGNSASGERFSAGRGYARRGLVQPEVRGRGRGTFVRPPTTGKQTWHSSSSKQPVFNANADEDLHSWPRSWNNNLSTSATRGSDDSSDLQTLKSFKSKRYGTNTNWRQMSREENEEWRSDTGRSKQRDKWGRDWSERPVLDKNQTWAANRRTWVGTDTTLDDSLPEWAVDNVVTCGGIFDSSGTFHGYSNDDSNLPKTQEPPYTLTRSHTHGSFVRQKVLDEGSEEWWAYEKSKKLSPKKFDAGDIKFKKVPPVDSTESGATTPSKDIENFKVSLDEIPVKDNDGNMTQEFTSDQKEKNENNIKFIESKTFDSLMRSDINLEDANDESGNFQSVMITPNNSLRQKHQNIVLPSNRTTNVNRKQSPFNIIRDIVENNKSSVSSIIPPQDPQDLMEYKIVEDLFHISLEDKERKQNLLNTDVVSSSTVTGSTGIVPGSTGIHQPRNQIHNQIPMGLNNSLANQGLPLNQNKTMMSTTPVVLPTGRASSRMHQVEVTNSTLGLSLNRPNNIALQHQNVPPPVLPMAAGMNNSLIRPGMIQNPIGATAALQGGPAGLTGLSRMSVPEVTNKSLFMRGNSNNSSAMQQQNGLQLPNNAEKTYYSLGVPHPPSAPNPGNVIFNNIMPQSASQPQPSSRMLADQWYYEDPKQIIQGPFSSQEMYNWYRAGFFNSNLMVRRACDHVMRPLGSYGAMVPFAPMNIMPSYQLPRENLLGNKQPGLGLNVESLWSQPVPSSDAMWMQSGMNAPHNDNSQSYYWEQPTAVTPNSLLPEGIPNERKTEDQLLAQLLGSQNTSTSQTLSFIVDQQPDTPIPNKSNETFTSPITTTPTLEELQKLIQKETFEVPPPPTLVNEFIQIAEQPTEIINTGIIATEDTEPKQVPFIKPTENKIQKQQKIESEKASRKSDKVRNEKNKKVKEDKKEETTEVKVKDKLEETKSEKRSMEASPPKTKKEEKVNKKDLEKEKKELVKDGFTIMKGPEKNINKDNKKKGEDSKAAEEQERKKKEEEKLAAEEEKKKKQMELLKKQEPQAQQQKIINELVMRKAPWSATSNQALVAHNKDGPTLAEIQRLEREKKLEQIKEQQHMMQIIAQQQAAAYAREQEIQAGLGWAKKKSSNNTLDHNLAEIQAEARKQAVSAAFATAQLLEESQISILTPINQVPWGNSQNGSGFWDTQPNQSPKSEKPVESSKISDPNKSKKKLNLSIPPKKETSPAAEFENWCSIELASWSSKIDVPTFIGFLKDIESPYEVKDYVKCYLGESKDSGDFARQFLERRSKLLRVGMVTPSDDLCSPAIAVNPRTISNSDYQEVKGKGKKTKKNKMLKVDSRILGFSVTAAEDRINVGDIDTV